MEKPKCIICGGTSFRIEEAQVVCNECNYVNEIQQEQFEEDYEEHPIDDHVNKDYLEKDFYDILKKLYRNDKLITKIKNYVFKENDEFFVRYQKVLLNFIYVFVKDHHLPPLLYDEVKNIWFHLLKVNIMNTNVYVPMGDAKDSVKSVFEVIRAQKLKDTVGDILNSGKVLNEVKNVIKKMGLSKLSYFFIIQKKIINETSKSLEFLPRKSEVFRRSEIKLLKLYKKTALLESEKKNKEDFLKINEIIHNIRRSRLSNQGGEADQGGDQNFAISSVGPTRGKREEGVPSERELLEAAPRQNTFGDNYEDFDVYERPEGGGNFNQGGSGDFAELEQFGQLDQFGQMDQFGQPNEFDQLDQFGELDRIDQLDQVEQFDQLEQFDQMEQLDQPLQPLQAKREEAPPGAAAPPKGVENFAEDENYAQAERVYHFYSSFLINQLLKNKKLFRPVDSNVSANYMNRSINHTNVIDLIYQHDFLYYFHEELRKKCDIEFLSFYDIMQVFKGDYDYLLPPSLGLSTGPYVPSSEGRATGSGPLQGDEEEGYHIDEQGSVPHEGYHFEERGSVPHE
ncbi:hypothetical protein PVIIG_03879, partial [Plasmodium vivax India VII]